MNFRNSKDIIEDIKVLVNRRGYLYALCLLIIEDFHFSAEEMHQIDNRSRLNKNEISLLVGFLIQQEITTEIPRSPSDLMEFKKATRELMEELHRSALIPYIDQFKPFLENLEEKIDSPPSKMDFFEVKTCSLNPYFMRETEFTIFNI